MIENKLISWRYASDSIIYILGALDKIRSRQYIWPNGGRLLKKKKYGAISLFGDCQGTISR
jgi:hypothetical protein